MLYIAYNIHKFLGNNFKGSLCPATDCTDYRTDLLMQELLSELTYELGRD